jgi:hypothetical protein
MLRAERFTPSEFFTERKPSIAKALAGMTPRYSISNQVRQQTVGKIGDLLPGAGPETEPSR